LEPRRDPMLDFAVKDTWRIFRIMGEFVEGFETLSRVKGVAIFGSSRTQPGSADYERAEKMGRALAKAGYAVITGGGPGDMEAANKGALEAGGEFWLGRALRADVAVWKRSIRNQGDPNVFFGTTVIFPNAVDRGEAKGLDLRLEMPRRAGFSGFVTYTLAKVDQYGPINGGLFLEADVIEIGPGTKFTPDHDQRHALSGEVSYENDRVGLWLALAGRYRSGTPLDVDEEGLAELAERPGAELVDIEGKRVEPYAVLDVLAGQRLIRRRGVEVSARASVFNVTNARYAFNFGNPFSGTHFGAPRSFRLDLRLALR